MATLQTRAMVSPGWTRSIDHSASGYEVFFDAIDGLFLGRRTYDFVHDYGQWPYTDKPTWIFSSRQFEPLEGINLQPAADPMLALEAAKSKGLSSIWLVGGGVLASAMMEKSLLTHISVSVMPVVLGGGVKLFGELVRARHIVQESSVEMGGFTQIEYRVKC